jgi:hypothetical protein
MALDPPPFDGNNLRIGQLSQRAGRLRAFEGFSELASAHAAKGLGLVIGGPPLAAAELGEPDSGQLSYTLDGPPIGPWLRPRDRGAVRRAVLHRFP